MFHCLPKCGRSPNKKGPCALPVDVSVFVSRHRGNRAIDFLNQKIKGPHADFVNKCQ